MSQIAKFMGPTWGLPGSCWHQVGPMLAPWTLLSGVILLKIGYTIFKCLGWVGVGVISLWLYPFECIHFLLGAITHPIFQGPPCRWTTEQPPPSAHRPVGHSRRRIPEEVEPGHGLPETQNSHSDKGSVQSDQSKGVEAERLRRAGHRRASVNPLGSWSRMMVCVTAKPQAGRVVITTPTSHKNKMFR